MHSTGDCLVGKNSEDSLQRGENSQGAQRSHSVFKTVKDFKMGTLEKELKGGFMISGV